MYYLRLTISLLLCCANASIYAQDYYQDAALYSPPSPTALALSRYANTSISLYTGTQSVSLPITELKTRNGGTIPVTLSYHGSGNKVQDIASWVGLGWSLNAGGVITRVVKGKPDDHADGFCGVNDIGEKVYDALTDATVAKYSSGEWDSEPDIFYFNFMGMTGRFILNEDRMPVFLPHSNLKVEPNPSSGIITSWVITDVNGVIYKFGTAEPSRESSVSNISGATAGDSFISSWYLDQIKYPLAGETVSFGYEAGSSISYKYYAQTYTEHIYQQVTGNDPYCTNVTGTVTDRNIEVTVASPKYLSSITTTHGTITFTLLADRQDLSGGRYLGEITVRDYASTVVENYRFNYSYFISDGCTTELCKRLKLDGVVRAGITVALYSFHYNSTNLPPRDSHAIDHWGYYNSNTHTSKVPTVTDTESPCPATYAGASKEPDPVRSLANILDRISYASGGYVEFGYGIHEYLDAQNNNVAAGGARIHILKECAFDGNCKQTNYSYRRFENNGLSSGSLMGLPRYHLRSFNQTVTAGPCPPQTPCAIITNRDFIIINSSSQVQLFDLNGYHIGYGNVKVSTSGNGYVENTFSHSLTGHADTPPDQFMYKTGTGRYANWDPMGFPFASNTSLAFERGLLTKRSVYSEATKQLLSEDFLYDYALPEVVRVPAYRVGKRAFDLTGIYYSIGKYEFISKPVLLQKVTTTVFDQTTPVSSTTASSSVTDYSYDMEALLPERISTYNSAYASVKRVAVNKYITHDSYMPGSWTTDESMAIRLMYLRHQWSLPVESQTLMEKAGQQYLLSSSVTSFQLVKPNVSQETTWYATPKAKFEGSPGVLIGQYTPSNVASSGSFFIDLGILRSVGSFDSYDPNTGNLLSFRRSNGVQTVITWGYNNNVPQYVVDNPTGPNPDLPGWQHRTYYEYKPMVGPTRVKDANDINSYYEYNSLGGLLLEKNHDSHITKRYRSHLLNSTPAALFTVSNAFKIPGVSQVFTADNSETIGNSRYTWDFGDGTVIEGTAFQVSHIFSTPGVYNVKLAKINPEYGSVTGSIQVRIYGTPSLSVSSGCTSIDLCNYNNQPCNITSSISGGCVGERTFEWYFKYPNGSWQQDLSTSSQMQFTPPGLGTFQFKCIVRDACLQPAESTPISITVYRSSSNCPIP